MQSEAIEKARILTGASPHFACVRDAVVVIRCSGSLLEDPARRKAVTGDVVVLRVMGARPVLVPDPPTAGDQVDLVGPLRRHGVRAAGLHGRGEDDAGNRAPPTHGARDAELGDRP